MWQGRRGRGDGGSTRGREYEAADEDCCSGQQDAVEVREEELAGLRPDGVQRLEHAPKRQGALAVHLDQGFEETDGPEAPTGTAITREGSHCTVHRHTCDKT